MIKRKVFLMFLGFKQHIGLSFLDNRSVYVEVFMKGELMSTPRGKVIRSNNLAHVYLTGEIPDEYDLRIEALFRAIGGKEVVRELISTYQASSSAIILNIPCKTSEGDEEGYLSDKIMRELSDLGLDIGFGYT